MPRNDIKVSTQSFAGERVDRGDDRMKPAGVNCWTTIDEGLGAHYTRKLVGLPPSLSLSPYCVTSCTVFLRLPGREVQHAELHSSANPA